MTGKVRERGARPAPGLASMRPGHYDREGEIAQVREAGGRVASMRPGHYDREGPAAGVGVALDGALQ